MTTIFINNPDPSYTVKALRELADLLELGDYRVVSGGILCHPIGKTVKIEADLIIEAKP